MKRKKIGKDHEIVFTDNGLQLLNVNTQKLVEIEGKNTFKRIVNLATVEVLEAEFSTKRISTKNEDYITMSFSEYGGGWIYIYKEKIVRYQDRFIFGVGEVGPDGRLVLDLDKMNGDKIIRLDDGNYFSYNNQTVFLDVGIWSSWLQCRSIRLDCNTLIYIDRKGNIMTQNNYDELYEQKKEAQRHNCEPTGQTTICDTALHYLYQKLQKREVK